MNKEFWKGKKVFITGHTGFKGSWLTSWLKLMGASVTGYSLPGGTETDVHSVYGNILDSALLLKTLKQQQPEIIFHLAAQSLVHYSYLNPIETYTVNVIGTANVLETIRSIESARAVVVVTSDKCYENQEWAWGYRETDSMGGFDPYSSSKGCAELVAASYRRSYFHPDHFDQHGVALATARAGNVIGGGDWAEARLIPDLIRFFSKNEIGIIRNPHAERPWQYILDPLQGYLVLAEQLFNKGSTFAEAWNFGPNDNNVKSVAWVANKLADLWGEKAKWVAEENQTFHEAKCLRLDSNKSRMNLGWSPKISLEETLETTLEWYKAHHRNQNMKEFTLQQIEEYETKENIE